MNKEGHLIWSEFILIIGMGGYLFYLLHDNGNYDVSMAIILSIATYLFGALLPDWDHPAVQKKLFFIKWLGKISHHRGHWHSLIAMIFYGIFLFPIFYFIPLFNFWYIPILTGMIGFFTHLLLDEIKNLITGGHRAMKLW